MEFGDRDFADRRAVLLEDLDLRADIVQVGDVELVVDQ
jgi:hypothetical protein